MSFFKKLFKTYSQKELMAIESTVDYIESLESRYKEYSDEDLRECTREFRERLSSGSTLEDILPEAFAVVREASVRVLGMRHFRVQLMGGIILHQGRIAEMRTGEGKTLVATLPAYLNALTQKGVHIVTVNDYLAKTQSEWMGKLYKFLGLTVGLIVHDMNNTERREAYACDITYGTNNEMGFDYLRDNMAIYKREMTQRGHNFAIVDEVDSILIDEARTPLIISGPGEQSTQLYSIANKFASTLRCLKFAEIDEKEHHDDVDADYIVDEKAKSVTLTASGVEKAEKYFNLENLSDPENSTLSHHINQAIRARGLMKRDVDYVVRDGEIIIVDEFTGRLMFGRRYSNGLHQAIEAKEGVKVERESKTFATITFQNYFRLYDKLSGMTGTALTEEEEFSHIYRLDVIEIPTNKPMIRVDHNDVVYKNQAGKYKAIINQIRECHEKGQPVLVGTVSIEKSEFLSSLLKKAGIKHVVLNAKHHDKEAQIVAQAGHFGAVTIATNMAGRGTDIMLGGNPEALATAELRRIGMDEALIVEATGFSDTEDENILNARAEFKALYNKYKVVTQAEAERVKEAGGLFIIGTERHESRRIDNQLRGRAGRQGDPGESRFFLALDDDIMRLFGSDRVQVVMTSLGIDEDTPIDQKMLSNAIENAQKKVESRNFQMRKTVLEYDDVMNKQREIIYSQRQKVLEGEDISDSIQSMIKGQIELAISGAVGESHVITPEIAEEICMPFYGIFLERAERVFSDDELSRLTVNTVTERLLEKAKEAYIKKEEELTTPILREFERIILLKNVDRLWMDHIDAMQELRNGIQLRAYAQHDPVLEYKHEGFEMFDAMISEIRESTVKMIYTVHIRHEGEPKRERVANATVASHGDQTVTKTPVKKAAKPGRNDPCPCGSGKKYKMCCGRNE